MSLLAVSQTAPDERPVQPMTRSLTVIVVAHNNAVTLEATVERLHRALVVTTEEFEIVIFDDGSDDDTSTIAERLATRFSDLRNVRLPTRMGAGHCFNLGSKKARSNFVTYVPADNTWPHRSYVELFGQIGKADIIVSHASNLTISMTRWRRFVSRTYTALLNTIFRFGLHYYNGLAIYPTAFVRAVKLSSSGFGFQAEALIRALHTGYSYLEVGLPIDRLSAWRSRSITPRNVLDALRTMAMLGVRFYLFPHALKERRLAANPVRPGQSVEELGLRNAVPSTPALRALAKELRIAIVGASSGIGELLARALGGDGHRVFICARRENRLADIARSLPSVRCVACDVTDEAQVAAFASAVSAELQALDVLINCAGGFGEIGPMALSDSERWWDTVRLNVFGPYLMIKHCLPLLEQGAKPRILNLAGGGAFSPFPNYSAYACAKAALVRLTECLAIELQPRNIRVNAIAPGIVATEMHKATLAAGEERAGRQQYRRAVSLMEDGGPSMDVLVECVRALLSPSFDRLTGKTLSSNFDPWQTEAFIANIDDISSSDLYTLRRLNVANLNDGYLRKTLSRAWANFGSTS